MDENEIHNEKSFLFFDKKYIAEFVYGGIDGVITTFAVVAGAAGAGADVIWVLIFGFANLIADGFSMSVGNYFSTKAERDNFDRHKRTEYWEIENLRETEIEEIREIYRAKGFEGELLEQVVAVITKDDDVWVDTMMREELEMIQDSRSPVKTAGATFVSFFAVGLVPLSAYLLTYIIEIEEDRLFLLTCILTGLVLIFIGNMKSVVTQTTRWKSILETLMLGGFAAFIAYYVGVVLGDLLLP